LSEILIQNRPASRAIGGQQFYALRLKVFIGLSPFLGGQMGPNPNKVLGSFSSA